MRYPHLRRAPRTDFETPNAPRVRPFRDELPCTIPWPDRKPERGSFRGRFNDRSIRPLGLVSNGVSRESREALFATRLRPRAHATRAFAQTHLNISALSTNAGTFTPVHRWREKRAEHGSRRKEDRACRDTELTWRNNVPWKQTEFPHTRIRVCLCGSRAYTRHNCAAAINN